MKISTTYIHGFMLATLMIGCGGNDSDRKETPTEKPAISKMGEAGPDGSITDVSVIPGSEQERLGSRFVFYGVRAGGLYKFDRQIRQSRLITPSFQYAAIHAAPGRSLYKIDEAGGTVEFLDSAWVSYVGADNRLYRHDAESDQTVPVPTNFVFRPFCDSFWSTDDGLIFELQEENCRTEYTVNVYTGAISSRPSEEDKSEDEVVFDRNGHPVGQIDYKSNGGSATYTDDQGKKSIFKFGSYFELDILGAYDSGPDLWLLLNAHPQSYYKGELQRAKVNKATGSISIETRATYDDDIENNPVSGIKIYVQFSRNDKAYGHYENLVDPSASTSLGEVNSITNSDSNRVAVAYPSAVKIFELSRGSTVQEQLVYESGRSDAVYLQDSGDYFLVSSESGVFDLIPMDPFETINLGQVRYLADTSSNRFKGRFYRGKLLDSRPEYHEDYFLTDFKSVDSEDSMDWQGARVQYWDQKARKMVAVGHVKSRITDGVGGCQTRNHFLFGTTFSDEDGKTKNGLFWIDSDTHQFGEEPAPGPVIAMCTLFRNTISSED